MHDEIHAYGHAGLQDIVGRSYLIVEGYSTEVEIITQAEAWLLLGRAAHTTLPIPYGAMPLCLILQQRGTLLYS